MKTKTVYLLVAFVSLLYLGGAYASYWEQGFGVSFTMDTGELSIRVENEAVSTPEYVLGEVVEKSVIKGSSSDRSSKKELNALSPLENMFSVTVGAMYPGSSIVQEFEVINTGTLGVFLDDITVEVLQTENECDWDPDDLNEDEECSCGHIQLNREMKIEYKTTANGSTLGYKTLSELLQETRVDEILVGESRQYFIRITFDEDKSLKENELEETNVEYEFHIHFMQYLEMNLTETFD